MTTEDRELIDKVKEMKAELSRANKEIERLDNLIDDTEDDLKEERLNNIRLVAGNEALNVWVEKVKAQMERIKESSIEVTIDNCTDMLEQGAQNIKNTGEAISSIMSHFELDKTK